MFKSRAFLCPSPHSALPARPATHIGPGLGQTGRAEWFGACEVRLSDVDAGLDHEQDAIGLGSEPLTGMGLSR